MAAKPRATCFLVVLAVIVLAPGDALVAQGTDEFFRAGPGVTLPRVIRQVRAGYTPDAMREQVQGRVALECIVELDGVPSHITVVRPLHPSLDAESVKAMSQWRFTPGTKDGKPARVLITLEMTFSLAPPSGPPQNVEVLRRTNADGANVIWDLTRERFDRQPVWRPDSATPPLLSIADALQTASVSLQKSGARTNAQLLQSASLLRMGGQHWYYRMDYALAVTTAATASERITVVVLLDGTVVEARTER